MSVSNSLDALFRPRSVAVIGASATPFKQGNVALKYLMQGGFRGAVYPVNPGGGQIEGLTCYPSISDIPGHVDCVFTVIPAALTAQAMRDCAAKGVRAAIIGASGFGELNNEAGAAREAEIASIARESGMRILGPNTNGIWNASDRFSLGFNHSHGDAMAPGGPRDSISIAAHSGALFNSIAPCLRKYGIGLSKFASVGNEADLDLMDVFEYLIEDEATGIIGLIVESLRDGERFRALAARACEASKPVLALKLGRSQAGAELALAHSSRLAGSARAYEALFAECGVALAPSVESLAGAAALLMRGQDMLMSGDNGLVCVTTSGGGGSLLADHAEDRGVPLAGEDGLWRGKAAKTIASFEDAGLVRNPIDGGNLMGWKRLAPLLQSIEADKQCGPALLYAHMLPMEANDLLVADILIARTKRTRAPLAIVSPGGMRPAIDAHYRANGAVVFDDLPTCFDAFATFYDSVEFDAEDLVDPPDEPESLAPEALLRIREILASVEPGDFIAEYESAEALALAGAPMVESALVASPDEAVAAAQAFHAPVAMKALAQGVAHKNEAGIVALGLVGEAAVREAHSEISQRLSALGGGRILMQPMAPSRAELILGVTHEPPLGHFLVLGLGGLHAELLDSIVLIPAFVSRARLEDIVEGSMAGALVARVAGGAAHQRLADVVETLVALRDLVRICGDQIASIDINPLLVAPKSCTAVDALIVRA